MSHPAVASDPIARRPRAGATLYSFVQREVLPQLSDRLQNYFAFASRQGERNRPFEEKAPRANWLHALEGKRDDDVVKFWGTFRRERWCTAGLLHAAGLMVTLDGKVTPSHGTDAPLFTFDPARVSCGANGVTSWTEGVVTPARLILTVRNETRYAAAMTFALGDLLKTLA